MNRGDYELLKLVRAIENSKKVLIVSERNAPEKKKYISRKEIWRIMEREIGSSIGMYCPIPRVYRSTDYRHRKTLDSYE